MAHTEIPRIEERYACIATDEQVELAAIASSCFTESSVYLPVFWFPSVSYPYTASSDFGTDGYLSRVLGDRASHRINNALSLTQPETVLMLGLTPIEQGYLRALLPGELLVEIPDAEGVTARFPSIGDNDNVMRCRPSDLIEGLVLAKFSRKRIVIDAEAPSLPDRYLHGGKGLIVIEKENTVNDVSAVNYTFAIGADVVLIPGTSKEEIRALPRKLTEWSKDRSHADFQELKRWVRAKLKGIDFAKYAFVTFFTRGIPYGLFIHNVIPCSHVLKDLECGVSVTSALAAEIAPEPFDSALVFSPEVFPSEESRDVAAMLDKARYSVTSLLGKQATVKNLSNYGGFFPYDLMHICTHGGETDGYFVMQKFTDRKGDAHTFEYYEIVGVGPVTGEKVEVHRKLIFKSFDGLKWMSEELSGHPSYIFEDMMKAVHEDSLEGVTRVPYNSPIALSCHIECHRSIHQGNFQSLASFGRPVILNNSCSSSHELVVNFIYAGARVYIGTLWNVGNQTATAAAIAFYEELLRHGNLLAAFVAMNKSVKDKSYANIYIFWGLHLSSLHQPSAKSDANLFGALAAAYAMWMKKIVTTKDPVVRRNGVPIVKFLLGQIMQRLSPERMKEMGDFNPELIQQYEKAMSTTAEDSVRSREEITIPAGRTEESSLDG